MDIDFSKIREIYGDEILKDCLDNAVNLAKSINYLHKLGFSDVSDIIERYLLVFLDDFNIVKEKLDKLIADLGVEYVEILDNNMGIWEELL